MTETAINRQIKLGDLVLTDYPFLTEWGMTMEAGDLVTSVLSSFIQDGDLEIAQRRGNMTLSIPLLVEGTDLLGLALAEQLLAIEAQKPYNTLTIDPGDGFGPPTVFETFQADPQFNFDDDLEQVIYRKISVTVPALPFGRSDFEVVAAAVTGPAVPVSTVISDGSSAAGWTATGGSAPTASGGQIQTTATGVAAGAPLTMTRTQNFSFSDLAFYVDWKAGARTSGLELLVTRTPQTYNLSPRASADGSSPAAGYTRSWFSAVSSIFGTNQALAVRVSDMLAGEQLYIDQIVRFANADGTGQTVVFDGSSTTNWAAAGGAAPATASGALSSAGVGTFAPAPCRLNRTVAIDVDATPFVWVDWKQGARTSDAELIVTTTAGPRSAPRVGLSPGLVAGYTRTYFEIPADATAFSFGFTAVPAGDVLYIDQAVATNVPPVIDSPHQQAQTVEVAGSARTQGTVEISSPTSGLGDVLVYSNSESDYVPAIRAYGPAGTPDPALYSGQWNSLATAFVMDVPADLLPPGLYALVARVSSPAGGARTLSWSALGRLGGATVGRTLTGKAAVTGVAYQMVPLGYVNLPTIGFRPGTAGLQRITLVDDSGTDAARVDAVYACNLTTGRLTLVSCGTGTPATGGASSKLWLDAATVINRTPSVMRGTLADGSDAFYAGDAITSLAQHEFVPPRTWVFTAMDPVDGDVALRHFPRWLGHAALPTPEAAA